MKIYWKKKLFWDRNILDGVESVGLFLLITSWAVTDLTSFVVANLPVFLSLVQLHIQLFSFQFKPAFQTAFSIQRPVIVWQLWMLHFVSLHGIVPEIYPIHAAKPPGIPRTACFFFHFMKLFPPPAHFAKCPYCEQLARSLPARLGFRFHSNIQNINLVTFTKDWI